MTLSAPCNDEMVGEIVVSRPTNVYVTLKRKVVLNAQSSQFCGVWERS